MIHTPPATVVRIADLLHGHRTHDVTPHDSVAEALPGLGRLGARCRVPLASATAIVMAKPMATGVNELRPPDQIAAHMAARTMSPDASPTPRTSPAGEPGARRPTRRETHVPKSNVVPPKSSPWPIASQTAPSVTATENSAASD